MLARLSGRCDPDDLAWTTLKDQKISDTDVVAWDGDRIGSPSPLDEADALTNTTTDPGGATLFVLHDYLLTLVTVMMRMKWMKDTVGSLFETMAEGVVVTVVIVVAHFGSRWWINGCFSFYFDFLLGSSGGAFSFDSNLFDRCSGSMLVFDVVSWLDASAILAFGNVNFFSSTRDFYVKVGLRVALLTGCFSSTRNFDVNLGLSVTLIGCSIASMGVVLADGHFKDKTR